MQWQMGDEQWWLQMELAEADLLTLQMLEHNEIPYAVPVRSMQENEELGLLYATSGLLRMKDRLQYPFTRKGVLRFLTSFFEAKTAFQSFMIEDQFIFTSMESLFVTTDDEIRFLLVPCSVQNEKADWGVVLQEWFLQCRFSQEEELSYVAELQRVRQDPSLSAWRTWIRMESMRQKELGHKKQEAEMHCKKEATKPALTEEAGQQSPVGISGRKAIYEERETKESVDSAAEKTEMPRGLSFLPAPAAERVHRMTEKLRAMWSRGAGHGMTPRSPERQAPKREGDRGWEEGAWTTRKRRPRFHIESPKKDPSFFANDGSDEVW